MKMMQDAFVACGWGAMDEPLGVVKNIDLEYSQAKIRVANQMDGNKRLSCRSQLPCFSKKALDSPTWTWPIAQHSACAPSTNELVTLAGGSRLWLDNGSVPEETKKQALWKCYPVEIVTPYLELAITRSEEEHRKRIIEEAAKTKNGGERYRM